MKIAVLTDSSAAFSGASAVLHLPLFLGNAEFAEGADVSDETIIRRTKLSGDILSLGQNPLDEIDGVLEKLRGEGYEACIAVHVSGGISGLGGNLVTCANRRSCPLPLYVFDSHATGIPQKHQVQLACGLAERGCLPEDIMSRLAALRKGQRTYLLVSDVRRLLKTGHISNHVSGVVPVKTLFSFNEDGNLEVSDNRLLMKNTYGELAERLEYMTNVAGSYFSFGLMYDDTAALDWSGLDARLRADFPHLAVERQPMKPSLWSLAGEKSVLASFEPKWELYLE